MTALAHHPLAHTLASRRLLPFATLEACVRSSGEQGRTLEDVLVDEGHLTRSQLLEILENEHFCPAVDVREVEPDPDALLRLPRESAARHRALPLRLEGDKLHLALADPSDTQVLAALRVACHREVAAHVGIGPDIDRALARVYDAHERVLEELQGESSPETGRAPDADDAPGASTEARAPDVPPGAPLEIDPGFAVTDELEAASGPSQLLALLIGEAHRRNATDVHLQPQADGLWCRLRIDGLLRNVGRLSPERAPSLVSHLKIVAGMDIAEHRRPQDGRTSYEVDGHTLDLRVSCVPSQFGEKVVARLLETRAELLRLEKLAMPPAVAEGFRDVLTAPLGLFLVTGPTGSGKTTTLYATLQSLSRGTLNISTLEDPIEYSLPGITQIQVNEEIGSSFASGLRALLRQDPDVILVGEIRDRETAEIACRAALTGHKVLSTLHTNDAVQAVTRLLDMGVPSHLITATLRGVLAQRLVRRICEGCREEVPMGDLDRSLLGHPSQEHVFRGRGCSRCGGTGHRGRAGIFEYFQLSSAMHTLIQGGASPFALRYAAQKEGLLTMSDFARRAALDGTTTVAEIQRVVLADEPQEQLCHSCERVVDLDFAVCPYCHATLKETCSSCDRPVESSWEACAHCGHTLVREWQKTYCRQCLAPVRPEWERCHYCDAEIG